MNSRFEHLLREIGRRNLPHGLLHWRYFMPGQSQAVRIHRELWLHSLPKLPRPIWLIVEIILWLRWMFWGAWRGSLLCVSRWGTEVSEKENIPVLRQAVVVLRLSLAYCLPPAWIYRFRLYRAPHRVWEYVYDHEIQAFHRFRGRRLGEKRESLELLQDKYLLSEKMREMACPIAEILALIPKGEPFDFSEWPDRRLFCKTRRGSRGDGAFVVGQDGQVIPFDGEKLQLAQDDYLVQPCYESHPMLARLTESCEAITVRLITENECLYFARLAIPAYRRERGERQRYVILPVDLETGEALRYPDHYLDAKTSESYSALCEKLEGLFVPFWRELVCCARQGQKLFPDIHSIAWDFIVTIDGPKLLEGNSGWDAADEQILLGGLLK